MSPSDEVNHVLRANLAACALHALYTAPKQVEARPCVYSLHFVQFEFLYITTSRQRRTREEVSSKDSEAAKNAEEMNRLRMQLELEKQKCTDAEVGHRQRTERRPVQTTVDMLPLASRPYLCVKLCLCLFSCLITCGPNTVRSRPSCVAAAAATRRYFGRAKNILPFWTLT